MIKISEGSKKLLEKWFFVKHLITKIEFEDFNFNSEEIELIHQSLLEKKHKIERIQSNRQTE